MAGEGRAWEVLRQAMTLQGVFAQRLTERLARGVPDVLWCHALRTGVVELKATDHVAGALGVRPEQALWLRQWALHGGHGGIVVWRARGVWTFYPSQVEVAWVQAIQSTRPEQCNYVAFQTADMLVRFLLVGHT